MFLGVRAETGSHALRFTHCERSLMFLGSLLWAQTELRPFLWFQLISVSLNFKFHISQLLCT